MLGAIFKYGITGLFLLIDGIVYFLVAQLFDLYGVLAKSQILNSDFITDVADRMYVVIGIFMLFFVTYSLLKALVNPDNVKDTGKIAINIVISLVLLSVVPTIFYYARYLQSIIVDNNIIGQLILKDNDVDFAAEGRNVSLTMLEAFLEIPDDATGEQNINWSAIITSPLSFTLSGISYLNNIINGVPTWGELKSSINQGEYASFLRIGLWSDVVVSDENASYIPIISTICGGFMIYCLISFCLDLGVRVIKLGFYQIIAPIPIMMRIIPNKKSVFDNWVKATLATYMEVFIRIFIMILVVFLASSLFKGNMLEVNGDLGIFGTIVVVLGLFAFAKQAPKLISNVIGIDSGNLKLGIGGKLDASGPLGKAINYIGKGTMGAIAGGIGGAYGAAINGASGASGFLYGAINGWKGKKGQFNKQRTNMYNDVLEQKGSAGWFGGRGIIDRTKEHQKDILRKEYLESEKMYVNNLENSAEFRNRVIEETNRKRAENQPRYDELSQLLSEKLKEFNDIQMRKIKELEEQKRQEETTFENNKLQKIRDLQLELENARNNHDIVKQNQLLSKISSEQSSVFSNTDLDNQIKIESSKTSTPEIDDIRKELSKVSTVDENAIFKSVQKEFMGQNTRYKTSSKYVAQKAAEKAAKEWRESHAEEAAIQEAIYENAFKNASKGGSVAGFGGTTGGGSSSSSGSSGSSGSKK